MTKGRACAGKRAMTKDEARRRAASMRRRFLSRMYAYKCPYSEKGETPHWHIGHRRHPRT